MLDCAKVYLVFNPAAGALLPRIVEENKLQQANSYFTIKSSLESILGVILAGVLYATLQIHTLFFLVGACFVVSGISEMFIRYDHTPSQEQLTLKLALGDMKDGLANAPSYLFHDVLTPELWSSVVSMCFGISFLVGAAILSAEKQPGKCGHAVAVRICLYAVVMIAWTVCYWLLVDRGILLNGFLLWLWAS